MAYASSDAYNGFLSGYDDYLDLNYDGTSNSMNIMGQMYLSGKMNNEIYTLKEMLQQPNRNEFENAMYDKVKAMFQNEIWEKVSRQLMNNYYSKLRHQSQDPKCKQIMMIWLFKRRRHPDGRLDKYKACLCCHGGQQQWGVQYWETYSPVISWMAVRTLLVLSKLHNLHTRAIDFTLVFPQADVKVPIFLHTPQGIVFEDNQDIVLGLKKNLYGLKDAGHTWWEYLSDGLIEMGFTPSQTDQCVFMKGDAIILIYVDDFVILSKSDRGIVDVMNMLRER